MPKPPNEFVQSLLELMEPIGPVSAKRMFGGYGIYLDGVMIGLVADDQLYLKVDEHSKADFQAVDSSPFEFDKNGKLMQMSYWLAPETVFDDPDEMLLWGNRAFEAALRQRK